MPTQPMSPSHKNQIVVGIGVFLLFITFGALYQASSQGDFSDTYPKGFRGGTCTIETSSATIGYSGYYLSSDYEIPENAIRTPNLAIQCGKMPGPGILDISIDLLYPESIRDIPLALHLVRINDESESAGSNQDKALFVREVEMLVIPAQKHVSGVVTHRLKLTDLGYYTIYLIGRNADDKEFTIKIPLKVGQDWKDHFKKAVSTFLKKE